MSAAGARAGMWPVLLRGATAEAPADIDAARRWASRLASLVTPALAAHLLSDAERILGAPLLDAAQVRESRLLARFKLQQQRRWAEAIAGQGIDAVYLKGFAAGAMIYGDPALRTQGDLDLLVREADLRPLLTFLADNGFRFFRPPMQRWGMISDASFLPLVSPDGECDIDIHVRPDCYPAHLSLTTGRVFAAARRCAQADGGFLAPSPEHAMALCVTNAAKDKFGLFALRKVIDAATMLRRALPLDWDEIAALAATGRYLKPARAFFSLLERLGADTSAVPAALRRSPAGPAGRALARVVRDFEELFPTQPSMAELLWRELALCAEPGVALHNTGLRLRGLFRPHAGMPAGMPDAVAPRAE